MHRLSNPGQKLDRSRRSVLRHAVIVVGGGAAAVIGVSAAGAFAQTSKRTQKMVQYQDTPKGRSRCDACSQWQPPASCKIVDGAIAPSGWCIAFAPKS